MPSAFAFSDVLPLAHKGMMRNLPRWLADPLGPLAIPPSYLPKLLPWLWRFWRAGSAATCRRQPRRARPALMKLTEAEWMGLLDRSGTKNMLREDGSLELYESEAEFSGIASGLGSARPFRHPYHHIAGEELAAAAARPVETVRQGTFVPGWKTADDPKVLGKALWAYAEGKGAEFVKGDVGLVMPSKERRRRTAQAGAHDHGAARL